MDFNAAFDIALSALSVYASIRGTTAPFIATQDHKSKASNDWIRKLGITRISSIYHLALIIATFFQCRKMVKMDSSALLVWESSGSRTAFRLMNVVNIFGGALRVVCFKVLGRFFTFDLAVQSDQKVIQSGPYALVRHPSYSAMILHQLGTSFAMAVYGPLIPPHWRLRAGIINVALTLFATVSKECSRLESRLLGN